MSAASETQVRYAYLMHFERPVSLGAKRTVRHHFGITELTIGAEMHAAQHGEHQSASVMAAYAAGVKVSIGYAARADHHPARELTSEYARKHCKHCIAEAQMTKQDAGMLELLERSVEVKRQRRLFK